VSDDNINNKSAIKSSKKQNNTAEIEENLLLEDIGSELSEDSYDYN
jgi:hypothetical protein